LDKRIPFETDGIVYKENDKIKLKIIGAYNTGFTEKLFDVQDNDEDQIKDLYESNYQELRNWIGNLNSNELDLKNQNL